MKVNVVIVDDLKSDSEQLEKDIRLFFMKKEKMLLNIQSFSSAEEMLACTDPSCRCDIVFLDICMAGMDGISLAKKLREMDARLLIVFMTTSRDYAFEAFPVHPFDYLVKPYEKSDLYHVLEDALKVFTTPEAEITIRAAYNSLKVPASKICSVLSFGHSIKIHMVNGQCIRSIMTFAELEKLLTADPRFLTCNRGVLINMDMVLSMDGESFFMKSGPACTLRVRDRSKLVSYFTQYQISRMKKGVMT